MFTYEYHNPAMKISGESEAAKNFGTYNGYKLQLGGPPLLHPSWVQCPWRTTPSLMKQSKLLER